MKLLLLLAGSAVVVLAQGRGGPPLMDCGAHADIQIICGAHSPEDLELTPDGKYMMATRFVNGRGQTVPGGGGFDVLDLAKNSIAKMEVTSEPRKDWGDPKCPGPVGDAIVSHGFSLSKRKGGAWQLYVVNHGMRQSMEMFELKQTGGNWGLVWHGCVIAEKDYNDVAALPDGSYIATHPTALVPQGAQVNTQSGAPSGWVARWTAAKGEEELPGTRAGYPNGVVASADGRYMYFNAWTAKEVHKYDLQQNKEVSMIKLDFMPDNLTWTKDKKMLAAGIKERGVQGFGVAEIDPASMKSTTVFDSEGKGALINGVSVALQAGNAIYVGAFGGDRVVKIPWKK